MEKTKTWWKIMDLDSDFIDSHRRKAERITLRLLEMYGRGMAYKLALEIAKIEEGWNDTP